MACVLSYVYLICVHVCVCVCILCLFFPDVCVQAHYAFPSQCRHFRDLDMLALQVGCLHLGTEKFLGLLLDKFNLEQ